MASPLVRRQILPPPSSTSTSQTIPPPSTTSTTTDNGFLPSIIGGASSLLSSIFNPTSTLSSTSSLEPTSTLSSSVTSSVPTVSSLSPTSTPPLLTTRPNDPVTVTETSSATVLPTSGTSETKGKSFLQNKPLSGFVFGLAGLAGLIVVVIAVTSYMRRRNRKRLLADASNFSFDPRDIEDRASVEEKHSNSGLTGRNNSGHSHNDYGSDNGPTGGFTRVGMGSISRPGPPASPMPAYIPQDHTGRDGAYPVQYHNFNNVPVGYNPTPNPYDTYGSWNGGGYSNGQGQHDPYNAPGSGGNRLSTNTGHYVPHQLQPGLYPAQGPTFSPLLSNSPPPLNRSPPVPSTTSPPPASLQPSASNQYNIPRLPTLSALPNTFGGPNGLDDDAYGGAFLGRDSLPPGSRTLQVANV